MAEQIATNEWLCFDEFDVSGASNNFGTKRSVTEETWTPFQPPTSMGTDPILPRRLPGVESMTASVTGQLDVGVNLAAAEASLARGGAITTKGEGRNPGDAAYLFSGKPTGDFVYGGEVGKVIPFASVMSSSGTVTPGYLFEFGPKSATAPGTSRMMLAATSTQVLRLHIHVVAFTGSASIVIVYETSAIGDFTDAVVRYTSTSITGLDKKNPAIGGPITDLNHRYRWTITGAGSFLLRLAAGIR
jgi:hypothetical protein